MFKNYTLPNPTIKYDCSSNNKSSGFDFIHKIVLLTKKDPDAINVLQEYLDLYPEKINFKNDEGW